MKNIRALLSSETLTYKYVIYIRQRNSHFFQCLVVTSADNI